MKDLPLNGTGSSETRWLRSHLCYKQADAENLHITSLQQQQLRLLRVSTPAAVAISVPHSECSGLCGVSWLGCSSYDVGSGHCGVRLHVATSFSSLMTLYRDLGLEDQSYLNQSSIFKPQKHSLYSTLRLHDVAFQPRRHDVRVHMLSRTNKMEQVMLKLFCSLV